MPSSTETSACCAVVASGSGLPKGALDDVFVGFEVIAVGDGVFARQRPAAPHVAEILEVHLASAHRRHPGAQNRNQSRRRRTSILPLPEQRFDATRLVALHVDDEHVGAAAVHADGEFGDQIALERTNPEHEETPESNGQQDDARLVTGTSQADDGMPERKPGRRRQRHDEADQEERGSVEHRRDDGEPDRHGRAGTP